MAPSPHTKSRPTTSVPILIDEDKVLGYTRYDGKTHCITCALCGLEVTLNENANPQSIYKHRDSENCKDRCKKASCNTAQKDAAAIRLSIGSTSEHRDPRFQAIPSPVTLHTPISSETSSPAFPFFRTLEADSAGSLPQTPVRPSGHPDPPSAKVSQHDPPPSLPNHFALLELRWPLP